VGLKPARMVIKIGRGVNETKPDKPAMYAPPTYKASGTFELFVKECALEAEAGVKPCSPNRKAPQKKGKKKDGGKLPGARAASRDGKGQPRDRY